MMRKLMIIAVFLFCVGFSVFAGGEAETGRSQAVDEVAAGQLLPIGAVDPANYLQDFAFEKSNTSEHPLLFNVELLKDSIWEKGGQTSVRISLLTNEEKYFRTVSGNFVLYFQNPELLRSSTVKDFLNSEILKNDNLSFYFFDPVRKRLAPVTDGAEIRNTVSMLSNSRKQYSNNVQLQNMLQVIEDKFINDRVHVLWITDENIIETQIDASFFDFAINVLSTGNTTFSYLGYGEVPNWTTLNKGLMKHNGNSYFADDDEEICGKIKKDITYFSKPAVEDITVDIVWSKYVTEMSNYYPREYYQDISGFYPKINNNRPSIYHHIGGMNYSEDKRFLHYLRIPALQHLEDNSEERHPEYNHRFKAGTVYVTYYVPMLEKKFYQHRDIFIDYVSSQDVKEEQNKFVLADTIIQNTPLIIQEIGSLVNINRNYLAAIQLVQTQKSLLQMIKPVRDDKAVDEDIELMNKYYDLLFNQAKTMNMLQ
jgi:hypothetical protein